MPLREQLERDGARLFKLRSYFPLLVIALLLVELWLDPPARLSPAAEAAWTLICLAIAFLGEGIRAYTVGRVPGGTSGRQTGAPDGRVLNTTGFYSVVRHPLYLGNFLIWVGLALLARSWSFELIVALVFWVYYERIMLSEEGYLRQAFGDAYLRWAETTPAFIPALAHWRPASLPFSWRVVIRREHSSVFAIIATFAAVVYARDWLPDGRLEQPHPGAAIFFLAGLALFLAAIFLTRRTRLLHVDGR